MLQENIFSTSPKRKANERLMDRKARPIKKWLLRLLSLKVLKHWALFHARILTGRTTLEWRLKNNSQSNHSAGLNEPSIISILSSTFTADSSAPYTMGENSEGCKILHSNRCANVPDNLIWFFSRTECFYMLFEYRRRFFFHFIYWFFSFFINRHPFTY